MAPIQCYHDSNLSNPSGRIYRRSGLIRHASELVFRNMCASCMLLLFSSSLKSFAQESSSPPIAVISRPGETNSQEALRAILGLEDQLRSNQLILERNGKEAREAAARNTELLSKRLQTIENAIAAQHQAVSEGNARELQAIQSSNRVLVILGGTFAAVASLAVLLVAYFQWRMSKTWAEISLLP